MNNKRVLTLIEIMSKLSGFKTICDDAGNEYVVYDSNSIKSITGIRDKTEFEALENHVHILEHVRKKEFEMLCGMAPVFCDALLSRLSRRFPEKEFIVYVSVSLNDSMIIRFHQKWPGEVRYYDPELFTDPAERVFLAEN